MNKSNQLLAIAIPTYNRATILEENLNLMLPEIMKNNISIYISDDSTNDDTKNLCQELRKKYPYIYYVKNEPSLGHDKNCIKTLKLPCEMYVWYIGDSTILNNEAINEVLGIIEQKEPKLISVNAEGRNLDIDSRLYTHPNELIVEIGWHLTLTGATIYSKKIIDRIDSFELDKFKNFPQFAIIFKSFESGDCELFWINSKQIKNNLRKTSYWKKTLFDVFLVDWPSCVNNLSFIGDEQKKIAIIKHSQMTKIFDLKSILFCRSNGVFDLSIFLKHYDSLKNHSAVNIKLLFVVALIPQVFIKSIIKLKNFSSNN